MNRPVTTALDVLGVFLVAGGVGWFTWRWLGPLALVVAGAIILAASFVSVRVSAPGEEAS